MVHAVTFKPIYKERIWGGRNLEKLFGRTLPADVAIGEAWDLADLPEDKSIVANGPMAGKTLDELVHLWGRSLLGDARLDGGQFPLLVKLLDANDVLSVQVHPDYRTAEAMGGDVRAKYEAWFVVAAEADACVYRGFKDGVTKVDVQTAIASGQLADLLIRHPAKPGDWFYLPGGTVHALGAGLVIAEIQTPSDTTFRLFDWNRIDNKTHQSRQLHIEQGLACLDFEKNQASDADMIGHADQRFVGKLADAPTFTLNKAFGPANSSGTLQIPNTVVWVALTGAGSVKTDACTVEFRAGDTILLPAGLDAFDYAFSEDSSYLHVELKGK